MNVEDIAIWILYDSSHYVVGYVGDTPRRSAIYSTYKG